MNQDTKQCTKCAEILPLSAFEQVCRNNRETNYNSQCKDCRHKKNQEHFSTFDGFINRLYLSLKHNAATRSKDLSIEITEDDIKDLYKKQDGLCVLTGIKMTHLAYQTNVNNRKINNYNISIDRINSSKGYTKDNVQLVCAAVNIMKSDLTEDELLLLAHSICAKN